MKPILLYNDHKKRFILSVSFEERDIPKNLGFSWDGDDKCWFTENKFIARKAEEYAQSDVILKFKEDDTKIRLNTSYETDNFYNNLLNMKLYPYQYSAVMNLHGKQHSILADEMGLGKTAIALESIKGEIKNGKRVLILAPGATLTQWQKQWNRWVS